MRQLGKWLRLGMVGALALGTAAVGAAPAGATVLDAKCDAGGHAALSPGVTATAAPTDFALDVFVSSSDGLCPAPSTAQAEMTGTLHSPATSCDDRGVFTSRPARGTLTLRWDESTTSTIRIKFVFSEKNYRLVGHVTDGLFAGDRVLAKVGVTKWDDFCKYTPLTGFWFSTGPNRHRSSLTFTHD